MWAVRWPWSKGSGTGEEPGRGPESPHGLGVASALGLLSHGAVVIDVRSRREFVRGHLPGARLVEAKGLREDPVEEIWGDDPLAETDRPVIVVSTTGARATAAAALLRRAGLDAWALTGGLGAWLGDGQVLVPGPPR